MDKLSLQDWIELIKAIGGFVAIVCGPIATAYVMIAATRAKQALEVSQANTASIATANTNINRIEANTNSISERLQAASQKLGYKEGVEGERASVAANAPLVAAAKGPVPVSDKETTAAVVSVAKAIEGATAATKKK